MTARAVNEHPDSKTTTSASLDIGRTYRATAVQGRKSTQAAPWSEPLDVTPPRPKTPAAGVPVEFSDEPITGVYEGEELERARRRRPTPMRIARLEERVDKLDRAMAVGFAESKATLSTLLDYAAKADAERERRAQADADRERDEADRRRKHQIAMIGAVAAAAAVVIAALMRAL